MCLCSLDTYTITELMKRKRPPQLFAPLGNRPYFHSLGIKDELVHTLDWFEGRHVGINVKVKSNDVQDEANAESKPTNSTKVAFDVTCTPAQHFTGRGLFDWCQTLWASWVVQGLSLLNSRALRRARIFTLLEIPDTGLSVTGRMKTLCRRVLHPWNRRALW